MWDEVLVDAEVHQYSRVGVPHERVYFGWAEAKFLAHCLPVGFPALAQLRILSQLIDHLIGCKRFVYTIGRCPGRC